MFTVKDDLMLGIGTALPAHFSSVLLPVNERMLVLHSVDPEALNMDGLFGKTESGFVPT